MTLMKAHYGDFVDFKEMTGVFPDEEENGNKIDKNECRRAAYDYDTKVANLVELEKWYQERQVPPSPKKGQDSQASTSDPRSANDAGADAAKEVVPDSPAK